MGSSSKTTTTKTVYGKTTTSNPYAQAKTNNSGTIAGFNDGTALNSVYNFVNKNIDSLLEDYLKPNLNSAANQAKLNSFAKTLANQTAGNLENNIINPLSKRNMIRSSQANDLYRTLVNKNTDSVSEYANNLLANSQNDTAKMLTNLLLYYMQGADYLKDMQSQSLDASRGNATKQTTTKSDGGFLEEIVPLAISAIMSSS